MLVAYAYQTDRLRGTVVLLVDLRAGTVIVDERDRLREVDVMNAALSAAAEVTRLQAAEPTRVAVRLYRSGPRAGLPKFSRSDDAAKRADVLAALAANERLETARASAAVRLAHCVDTLANGPVDLGTPAKLAEAQTMRDHMERLRGALPWAEAVGDAFAEGRAWCSTRLDELHRHVARLASIEAHGFGVGARVVLQRSPYAAAGDDEPIGPGGGARGGRRKRRAHAARAAGRGRPGVVGLGSAAEGRVTAFGGDVAFLLAQRTRPMYLLCMEADLMSDALDDLRDDYLAREGFALDAEIAALCDECSPPVAPRDAAAKVAYAMELLASGAITTFYAIGWSPLHLLVWMSFVTGNQAADIVQRCAAVALPARRPFSMPAPVYATFYSDGQTTRHEMVKAGDYWVPRSGMEPLRAAERVVLDDGTVVKDRYGYPGESKAVRHRLYSDGIRKGPRRMTAAERNAAEVQAMYGPRRPLKCEVAR